MAQQNPLKKLVVLFVILLLIIISSIIYYISTIGNTPHNQEFIISFKKIQSIDKDTYKIEINYSTFDMESLDYFKLALFRNNTDNPIEKVDPNATTLSSSIIVYKEVGGSGFNTTLQFFDHNIDNRLSSGDYFILKNIKRLSDYYLVLSDNIIGKEYRCKIKTI